MFFTDRTNNALGEIGAPTRNITTVAGSPTGVSGSSGDGSGATSALLCLALGIALDQNGNLLIADFANSVVREVDATTQVILTVAGQIGSQGYAGNGGSAISATRTYRVGIAVDSVGNLLIPDTGDDILREVVFQGNSPPINVTSASPVITLLFTFGQGGPTGTPSVLAQRATLLDLIDAGAGTCITVHGFPPTKPARSM